MSAKEYNHKGYKIFGWFDNNSKEWYKNHTTNIKNGIIVEIGVFGGASLMSVADICKENNSQLYGIDPWELIQAPNGEKLHPQTLQQRQNNLKGHRLKLEKIIEELNYSHITLIQDFSKHAAKNFKDNTIDLVYIDGSHDYKSVTDDLKSWFPKIKKTGILGGDDWKWDQVQKAVIDFGKKHSLKVINKGNHWEIIF